MANFDDAEKNIASNFDKAVRALKANTLRFRDVFSGSEFVCINRACPFDASEDNSCGSWCPFFGVSGKLDMLYLSDLSDDAIERLDIVCITCRYTNTLIGKITKEDSSHA